MDLVIVIGAVAKVAVIVGLLQVSVALLTWVERRGSALIQLRRGPNRVGPFGLLQPMADGIKFFFKEDVLPPFVHKPTFIVAPAVSLFCALMAFAVIPFGGVLEVSGREIPLVIANIDAGVLLLLAASGLGVYGIILAGWASNNKYSQLGGLRASAQMISYELSLGLGVIAVLVLAGTLNLSEIVELQSRSLPFVVYLPLGFVVLLIAGFAETNRLPFDLPEAESELVAGYHTEYSSMKFSMFFMAEYINMITSAALLVTLYLGGYGVPRFIAEPLGLSGNALVVAEVVSFAAKVAFFLWVFVWVRWTLPRFRFDQLMRVGWKALIPLGFANVIWAALLTILKPEWFS
ncbi:MAG TPA: NADH-quinone oxidoreductase subunit NuoH [Acidobacteria bacterium]|nr:NADH-quinone oxidoreductase subunit NuoH [Acidobacteriota bacterium]